MKKSIFLVILLILNSTGFCQEISIGRIPKFTLPEHKAGDFSVSATAGIMLNTPNMVQPAAGLKISVFAGKYISFDSDIMFGKDYIHAGPGIIGIPLWFLFLGSGGGMEFESFSEVGIFLALAALSFEHIAGHIPVSNSFELSPYLSLLKYRSSYEYGVYEETNRVNEQLAATIGLELNKYFKRFLLSPYIETSMGYKDGKLQLNTGVSFGIFFAR